MDLASPLQARLKRENEELRRENEMLRQNLAAVDANRPMVETVPDHGPSKDRPASETALKEREAELRKLQQRLLDAIEAVPSGLLLFDPDDRLILCNEKAKELNPHLKTELVPGLSFSDYLRLNISQLYPDLSGKELEKIHKERLQRHRTSRENEESNELVTEVRPGFWLMHKANRTAEGGWIGIQTDVTELKAVQEKLEAHGEELARSNEELEQFAYLASHDMQEPLRVIGNFCDLLQLRYADRLDDDGKEFIAYAVDGARRMRSLLDDLLTYSRVGRSEIKMSPVSLADVMGEVRSRLSAFIEDRKAKVTFDKLPTVGGDQTLLTQLLQNLVGNGIKFHGKKAPRVHVSAEQGRDFWTVSVSDNGIGIEPEHADRVFQMFQRLHGRDDYAGNGLGLALCKRAVERHGGKIWIEPTKGPGSTVKFTLPV